jgi:hypothetical protein
VSADADRMLEGTPSGTRIAYLTAAGEVIVCGEPPPETGDEDGGHNCDAMGCSSVSHVVERYRIADADRIAQLTAELAEARREYAERETAYWDDRKAELRAMEDERAAHERTKADLADTRAQLAKVRHDCDEMIRVHDEVEAERDAAKAELAKMRGALEKVSAIRDSIVGMQGFNFSEHAYPLVAALKEAGFEGSGYEIARANLGTLIEQRDAAIAREQAAQAERDSHLQRYLRTRQHLDAAQAETAAMRVHLCSECEAAIRIAGIDAGRALASRVPLLEAMYEAAHAAKGRFQVAHDRDDKGTCGGVARCRGCKFMATLAALDEKGETVRPTSRSGIRRDAAEVIVDALLSLGNGLDPDLHRWSDEARASLRRCWIDLVIEGMP